MLIAGDTLVKTLAKSQKVTFWSQKNGFGCFFFFLTAVDALINKVLNYLLKAYMGRWASPRPVYLA